MGIRKAAAQVLEVLSIAILAFAGAPGLWAQQAAKLAAKAPAPQIHQWNGRICEAWVRSWKVAEGVDADVRAEWESAGEEPV